MANAKISIITVCFKAVNCIEKTILSVINQTYPNIEHIIIDGDSTDGTVDVIKKFPEGTNKPIWGTLWVQGLQCRTAI